MVAHFSPLQQEDSVLLWKSVCSNKLLAKVELVLFLNKCDLMEAKLKSGIRLAKYVRSFGDRSNDLDTTTKCTCRNARSNPWPSFDLGSTQISVGNSVQFCGSIHHNPVSSMGFVLL
jgi:hypothetical protein